LAEQHAPAPTHASATGQALTEAHYLDTHYEACRPEYEAMLRAAGFAPGSHVLDAGCGGGSFLPLLAELVGATGRLTALDLAPDNVAAVRERLAAWALPCPVEAQAGGVTALPFADATFDAVWCANVLMYLDDDACAAALAEFRRVTRPGGLVAVKELDVAFSLVYPATPGLSWRLWDGLFGAGVGTGPLRSHALRRLMEAAGFAAVRQRTTVVERWAPLRPVERRLWGGIYAHFAGQSEALALPEADRDFWREQRDPASPGAIINHPEFYLSEGDVLAVGIVPAA